MRNETVASSENNRATQDFGTPLLVGAAQVELVSTGDDISRAPLDPAAWAGDFPADFTDEEKFFMLDIATLFPSEREFVALLGGDAAAVWDIEPEDDSEQHARLEQRVTSSVFERLKLPSPSKKPRKK